MLLATDIWPALITSRLMICGFLFISIQAKIRNSKLPDPEPLNPDTRSKKEIMDRRTAIVI
jgi:hypothetical protein